MYNIDAGTSFPTYAISPIQNIHLRFGKVLRDSPVIIEEQLEDEKIPENLTQTIYK